MKVADVMTRGVTTVGPEDLMTKAAHLMLQYDMSGLPVVDRRGKLFGIVTEGDFLRRAETGTERPRRRWLELLLSPGQLAAEYAHAHGRKVEEVMTRDVVTVSGDSSLENAVELMESHHIKRLPVVRGDAVVGIVTRNNLLHAFIVGAAKPTVTLISDAAINEQLVAELAEQPWAPHNSIIVTVKNGVVELQGVILDERQRVALRVAAENIPGVKEVRDRLRKRDT